MTTAVIVGVLLLLAVGLVASQLFRLKDWLDRQPKTVESTDENGDDVSGPGPHAR